MSSEPFGRLRRFLRELKRRNVYKVAVAYVAVAFVVLQGARLLVPALVLPEWFYRVVVAAALLGFPLALVLAWAFEMTAEGVRRTEAPQKETAGGEVYQWIGLAVVVLLAGGVWYATAGSGGPSSVRTATSTDTATEPDSLSPQLGNNSIAVLPFEALGQEEPGAFTEGMHDALLTRLSNVSGLKVVSRTAVQQYRGSDKTTGEVARELGVRWVLEGGVQEMGDQIQVNAQLIDPHTEMHAWSESYRRDLTAEKLFALQSDITKKIARSLEARLSPEEQERIERQPTTDLDAYQLYVRGRTRLNTRTRSGIQEAVDYFRRAIDQDSSYALAWSGLADAVGNYPIYVSDSLPTTLPEHQEAARRAVELAPSLAEARASLGFVYFTMRRPRGISALRALKRAVELKPSYAQAHHWLGWHYLHLGRPDQAYEHLSLAVQLAPDHTSARTTLVAALLARGEISRAENQLGRIPSDRRYLPHYGARKAYILGAKQRWEELEDFARKRLRDERPLPLAISRWSNPVLRFHLGRIAIRRGDTATAREHLAQIHQLPPGSGRYVYAGLLHVALGEVSDAFSAWQSIEMSGSPVTWSLRYLYPELLGPLRGDPRFRDLIRRFNQDWGLNPDGSLPDSVNVSFGSETDD